MSRSTQLRTASRERRSHAARTAAMRARVMTAVVESIAEVGYQRTTAAEIARRAGVTWGAVQHHFGDKYGILMAVLRESFEHFAACLADPPEDQATLEERVDLFVDRSWEHFSSPLYRSTFQILLNLPSDLESSWQQTMLGDWSRVWARYFYADRRAKRRDAGLMRYTLSVLSGLAAMQTLEGSGRRLRSTELGFLKETLRQNLAYASDDSRSSRARLSRAPTPSRGSPRG